jgi:hypothetical protein
VRLEGLGQLKIAICTVRQIIKKALEYNSPVCFCFTDLEKAFGNLNLESVLEMLEPNNVPKCLITLILLFPV